MRMAILIGTAAIALTACNRADDAANMTNEEVTTVAEDTAMTGDVDANAATNDTAEANMVANDLTHNDVDTNLANGM